ncbi:tyrosine-type recombinase/integrase [Ancylobacter sp. IITR112]|uniref:tyrosine-type recombinase/integrase n=1 Tax=Ancylobacter sp. IITR112 TaxID=3138073 RepID=UPI00352BA4B7
MGLWLVAPMKRKNSSNHQFVQRIPADVRPRLVGVTLEVPLGADFVPVSISGSAQAIRVSLRTFDPSEAKRRQATIIAHLEGIYAGLRAAVPATLSHKQSVALSGEVYRAWAEELETSKSITIQAEADGTLVREHGIDPEEQAAGRRRAAEKLLAAAPEDREREVGPLVNRILLRNGIPSVDEPSRRLLLGEFIKALADGLEASARMAEGDYSEDPKAKRFPEWQPPAPPPKPSKPPKAAPAVSMRGLFAEWWREAERAGRSVSTKDGYSTALERLIAFLGHDDAAKVTAEDIVRFKDHMVSTPSPATGKPLSAKTIKDSYLAGLKSVFGWAVVNLKLASNPAEKVSMKSARKQKVRQPWFTEEEASAILSPALNAKREDGEPAQRFALRRWVPWLCAYTGARVGEMVQLRKQDVRQEAGQWVISITPEAVTVKGGQMRTVPLHPHLVELGFVEFVQSAPAGFLFMWSGTERASWRYAKKIITEEVRKVVTDPNVQPNHGWRHTFKALGGDAGIEQRTLDAIQGHAPRTEGETYGGVTIKAMAAALERFPWFVTKLPERHSRLTE